MTDTSGAAGSESDPAISVLMPCYNAGEYLRPAIDSALSQLSEHDEILVQDAKSTDGSAEYLVNLSKADPRVKPVFEKDNGQSDALNRALARAANPWVIWLNADDLLLKSSLYALREAVRANPELDLVIGGHRLIRADNSVIDDYAGRTLETSSIMMRGCAAFSGSMLMRTEFVRQVGGWEPDLHFLMDLSLQLRMAQAHARQIVISVPVGALRFHIAAKSGRMYFGFVRESHSVRRRHAANFKQRIYNDIYTMAFIAIRPIWRFTLTPWYRTARRRVVNLLKPGSRKEPTPAQISPGRDGEQSTHAVRYGLDHFWR